MMKLDGKQKRIAAAIAAGGMLALVVLLSRGRSSAGVEPIAATDALGAPTSFADNGAAMGQLSTSISDLAGRTDIALGNLGAGLEELDARSSTRSDGLADSFATSLAGIGSLFALQTADPPAPAAPPMLAAIGKPAGAAQAAPKPVPTAAQAKAAAQPNVSFNANPESKRAALNFQTVIKGGNVWHYFESAPGKGDYGKVDKLANGALTKLKIRPVSGQKP